jgi:hypothetical protein
MYNISAHLLRLGIANSSQGISKDELDLSVPQESHRWNPVAPVFVPMTMQAVPQQVVSQSPVKSKKTKNESSPMMKAKRAKSAVLEDEEKKPQPVPSSPSPRAMPEVSEEEWQHRMVKRGRAIVAIKQFPEYQNYFAARARDERREDEPQTPRPDDRTLSKRRWEYEVQQWRMLLKQWSQNEAAVEDIVQPL